MLTCLVQMHSDRAYLRASAACDNRDDLHVPAKVARHRGFTLIEMVITISIISLLVLMAQVNFYGAFRKATFRSKVQELMSTIEMAARGAAEGDRRYEVIVDLTEQTYMLREMTSTNVSEVLDEEIIVENDLGEGCWFEYVTFDDNESTSDGRARFRVGHRGWQYGGKIVLADEDGRMYSIVVNRLNGIVTLKQGDVELLLPRTQNDMLF